MTRSGKPRHRLVQRATLADEHPLAAAFDWDSFPAGQQARLELVPDMIRDALRVLEDLLDATNHALTFTLDEGPLTDNDVAASIGALLQNDCWVEALEPVTSWAEITREALPGLFIPTRPQEAWIRGATPRELAETITDWTMSLLHRLWPADAEVWSVTVECRGWYEAAYVDIAVRVADRMWLLHLGVTD